MNCNLLFEKVTIDDALFILERLQEEYSVEVKHCMCDLQVCRKLLTGTKESVGIGDEKERNIRSFG